jgi:6,7-dimethyl-8-ribityllumazine synthase
VSEAGAGALSVPAEARRVEPRGAADARIGVVASRYNAAVVQRLLDGAVEALGRHGIEPDRLTVVLVPGAWELPLACRRLAETEGHAAVVALGCVIRGGTPHFDYVCAEAARGIARVSLDTGVPVAFGLLTCDTEQQALDRAGGRLGNKGAEAADAAVEMAGLMGALAPGP